MTLKIGKNYGADTDMDSKPTIQIKETLDVGYGDITSVETWMTVGVSHYDYLFCREQSKLYLGTNPWSGLTSNNKLMSVRHYLVGQNERDEILTTDEQFKQWGTFVSQSKLNRVKRWSLAKNYASFVLTPIDSLDLAKTTDKLSADYKEYGIESNVVDGLDGLVDWFQGTSSYVGVGLPNKGYHTQVIEDKMVSIITNGY